MHEHTVKKYWIKPDGTLIDCWPEHQLWAWDNISPKIKAGFKAKWQAEDWLKDNGWLRCQVYTDDGLGVEGKPEYLNRNAQNLLEVLPEPRRVYVQVWPVTKPAEYFGADTLDSLGWDKLAAAKKKRALFAMLLRQIANDVRPEDRKTLQERWAKRNCNV